jgi:hypothetical protein
VAEATEAMRLADTMRRRETEMVERERHLREREAAVAAQQRVLEEQARLLASQAAPAPTARTAPDLAPPRAVAALAARPLHDRPVPAAPVAGRVRPGPEPASRASAAERGPAQAADPAAVRRQALAADRAAAPPRTIVPAAAPLRSPAGERTIRVQSFQQPLPAPRAGFWERLRRVLFGQPETEAGG